MLIRQRRYVHQSLWSFAFVILAGFAVWVGLSVFHTDVQTPFTETQKGEVAEVISVQDGDTFTIANGNIVRLIGIDAPERNEPLYNEAKNALADRVLGQHVLLIKDKSEVDDYGRLLRYVWLERIFINGVLVREGWVEATPIPPDTEYANDFYSLEERARNERKGMWQ